MHPLLLSYFNENKILSTHFRKTLKYQILWKYVQWQPGRSMRTDEETKLVVAFNIREREYLEDPGVDGRIILR
jgi:hypothetical protein